MQSGKIVKVATAPAGNATITVAQIKYADTIYYQTGTHQDYVQESH
jgi:hypothetical protein